MEKKGIFNEDVNPVDWDATFPVTEDFPYIQRGWMRFKSWLSRIFIITPFTFRLNKFQRKTKVLGRKNIKGIKSAIVTANHIDIFDCLTVRYGLKHKLKYSVAEINNRKGFLGDMMRADGIMPLSEDRKVMRAFSNGVEHHLLHNGYVVFYPEQSMWFMFKKPRPFKKGAFHYAVKFDVPVIPTFITMRGSGKFDEEGLEYQYFTLHIMPPIFPKEGLSTAENVQYMMDTNFALCKQKYEEVYGKPLKYASEEK